MDNFKVSVIIPMFNASKCISNTLNSIINQDFDDYEIIIINDGSEDDSYIKAENILSKTDIHYTIFNQSNKGVSASRNKGIELSKGEYILFVDDDDLISKTHISSLYYNLNKQHTDFAYSKLIKTDERGNQLSSIDSYNCINNKDIISTYDLIKLELTMKIPFSFAQILYKSSIIKDNNLKFDINAIYGEDTEFALKTLIFSDKIAICSDPSYFYIQHENSAISNAKLNRFEFIKSLENLADFYQNNMNEYNKEELSELLHLVKTNRIPKAIFGNMLYFFVNDFPFEEVINKMKQLNLLYKLSLFEKHDSSDKKFLFKSKLFLLSPKLYYKLWKKFKNNI